MRLRMTTTTLTGLGALSPLALAFTLGVTGCDERRDQRTTTTAPAATQPATQEERRTAAPAPGTPAPRAPEAVRPTAPEDPGTVTPTNLAADERRKKGDGDAAKVLAALHKSNMNELALAKLGQQKAQMREVKQFSQMLLKEHSKADQMVMAYAKRKAISLTPDEDKAEDKREAMEKLRPLRGVEFDREFAAIMVDEHDKAVDLVKDARGDVDDPELKGMLAELQGSLEKHLEHARHLRDVTKDAESRAAGEGKDDPATRQGRRPTR